MNKRYTAADMRTAADLLADSIIEHRSADLDTPAELAAMLRQAATIIERCNIERESYKSLAAINENGPCNEFVEMINRILGDTQ